MKIAVVGAGSIGSRHIRNLIALGVPAGDILVVDPSPRADLPDGVLSQATWPCVDFGFDAVLICSPASTHAEFVKLCIDARLPFFLEKPATLGVGELSGDEWQTDVPHLVACNMRFRSELRALRDRFYGRQGVLVRMLSAADMRQWPGLSYGPMVAEMSHEIDLALWLMGGDQVGVTSAHVNGSMASIWLHHRHRGRSHILLDGQSPTVSRRWRADAGADAADYHWSGIPSDVNQMYLDEMAHFLRVVRGHEPSCNTLADARLVVEICEQVKS